MRQSINLNRSKATTIVHTYTKANCGMHQIALETRDYALFNSKLKTRVKKIMFVQLKALTDLLIENFAVAHMAFARRNPTSDLQR